MLENWSCCLSSALSKMSSLLYILNKESDHCFLNKSIVFVIMEEEANLIYKILWIVIFLSHLSQTIQTCGAYIFTLVLLRWFGSLFFPLKFLHSTKIAVANKRFIKYLLTEVLMHFPHMTLLSHHCNILLFSRLFPWANLHGSWALLLIFQLFMNLIFPKH